MLVNYPTYIVSSNMLVECCGCKTGQWLHNALLDSQGHFSLFKLCSLTIKIADELFNRINVPHTKFFTYGVLETKSKSVQCTKSHFESVLQTIHF